jgi:hypothetical protein
MFGGVFKTRPVGQNIGADDRFQFVSFDQKSQLRGYAVGCLKNSH